MIDPAPRAQQACSDHQMDGLRVLVTGAGGAIGAAVARAFAHRGCRLLLNDLNATALDRTYAAFDPIDPPPRDESDLSTQEGREALLDHARGTLGGLDAVVHTAAVILRRESPADVSDADWDLQNQVNLKATFFLIRDVAEEMRAAGTRGRIIAFSSQAWWSGGLAGSVVYAATKGGVVSLVRGLARSYAPDGILINCIAPGAVESVMIRSGSSQEDVESLRRSIPLGRFASAEEVAEVAVFLASTGASYITGTTLNVTGGLLAY